MRECLDAAVRAAQTAGLYLRNLGVVSRRQVVEERGRDLKLMADRESEALIISSLQAATPFAILSEERGMLGTPEGAKARYWVVDPLDGTVNYAHGIDFCCVSIALLEQSEPILGVIHDFSRQETFSGIVADGAWLNSQRIYVSETSALDRAILCTGFPVAGDFSTSGVERFTHYVQQYKKVRLLGSAALSLAYVAAGRVDSYAEHGLHLWDVAAGIAIVRAAGGMVNLTPWAGDATLVSAVGTTPKLPLVSSPSTP